MKSFRCTTSSAWSCVRSRSSCWKFSIKNLIGVRHFQCLLTFFTLVIFEGLRTSLSVAIISMTAETPQNSTTPTYPEWTNSDTILSSFFWGYIVTQVGAGQLSEYFGPKRFLVTTMVLCAVVNLAIPWMASVLGSIGVIMCSVFQGLNQGFLYPCVHNLMSRWTPIYERSKVSNFVYGGADLGIAVSMVVTGSICGSWGWPVAFYLYGGLGVAWAVIFAIFAANTPSAHKKISEEEKKYIESTTSITKTVKKVPTPWFSIMTSVPMWAILAAGVAQCFGYFTLLTEIPSYLNGMMGFDINSNSQLSALPYVVQFVLTVIVSPLFDSLVANKTITITASRKISNSIASFLPAAALIYLAFLQDFQADVVVGLLIVAVGTTAFAHSGYMVNLIDLAPNHSGTLFGIVSSVTNIFSILAPLSVGFLGNDKKDPMLWRKVFLLSAGLYKVCGVFYVVFTTAEVQPWNDKEERNTQDLPDITNTRSTEEKEVTVQKV